MKRLLQSGAVAAFLSVITTIGIHGVITGPSTFEESLVVFRETPYILSKWWVILHCLLVVFSAYGLMHHPGNHNGKLAGLGYTFYVGFGIIEITRMSLVLTYLFNLREKYLQAGSDVQREIFRAALDSFSGIGEGLFVAFIISFLFGNLFFGLSLVAGKSLVRVLGVVLLIWSAASAATLMNVHLRSESLDTLLEYFSISFQPAARLLLGICLWRASQSI